MADRFQFIAPAELAAMADLQLLARTVVAGMAGGVHRSARTGSAAEFAQYRTYTQGDDPRFVDWRLYGRSDRLYVRQFREETNLRCTILLDCSASMDYGSGAVDKFRYAQMLVACLATLATQQRDEVGFAAFGAELDVYIPGRARADHLHRLLAAMANVQPRGGTDTEGVLRFVGDALPARGMIVLVSDLLHPIDNVLRQLRTLRARRHDVLVLQISDRAEREFPFERAVTLRDAEEPRELFAVPSAVRAQYLANRDNHFAEVRRACLAAEIDIEEFSCDEPLDRALQRFLFRRSHALLSSSRRSA
jgi:uncharacterized protein (DUF58 family)